MKKQFKAAFYKKVLLGLLAITFFLNGCTTTSNRPSSIVNPDVNYTLPRAGSANNAALAVKDYLTLGIFWVSSTETIDGDGNRTGSQITYEMLMREAQKLDADDIINIRIDVKQIHEFVRSSDFSSIISKTTYIYTANALAIKYTAATGGGATQSKSLEAVETLPQQQRMPASSTSRSARSSTVTEASTPSLDTASSTASSGASTPYRDTERSPAVAEPSTPSRNNAAASSSSSAVIADNYTVESITGRVERQSGSNYMLVRAGDVLAKNTMVYLSMGASLTLTDGSMNVTIPAGTNGSVEDLVRRYRR